MHVANKKALKKRDWLQIELHRKRDKIVVSNLKFSFFPQTRSDRKKLLIVFCSEIAGLKKRNKS